MTITSCSLQERDIHYRFVHAFVFPGGPRNLCNSLYYNIAFVYITILSVSARKPALCLSKILLCSNTIHQLHILTTCFDNKHSQKCSLFFCSKQKYSSACGQYSTLITLDLCISSAGLQKSNTIAIHPKVRCISNVSWSPLINAF